MRPGDIKVNFETGRVEYDDGVSIRVIDIVRDAANDLILTSTNQSEMWFLDDTLDAIGIRGAPVAGGATAGGSLQVFAGRTTALSPSSTDQMDKGIYVRFDAVVTGAVDAGVHRGINIDYDYDFDNASGLLVGQLTPLEVDVNLTTTNVSATNTPNAKLYRFNVAADAKTYLHASGAALDSPHSTIFIHTSPDNANIPVNGYIGTYVKSGKSTTAVDYWGIQNRFDCNVAAGWDTILMDNVAFAQTGHAGNHRGIEVAMGVVTTCAQVANFSAVGIGGSISLDKWMSYRGVHHAMMKMCLIAHTTASVPGDITTDHLDFTDSARAGLYIEDDAEIDGITYADGGVSVSGAYTTASTTAGGMLQVHVGDMDGSGSTDADTKAVYVHYNSAITAGNDFGTHRAFHVDWDYDYNNGAGLFNPTMKPFELDIDATFTAGTPAGSETLTPFIVDVNVGTGIALKPCAYIFTHNANVGSKLPLAYFRIETNHNPAGALAAEIIALQVDADAKLSGAGNRLIALNLITTANTGFTAKQVGILQTMNVVSGATQVIGLQIAPSGTPPSLDVCMGVDSPYHIITDNSLIAANSAATPAGLSPGHVSFTDGTANLYVEDNAEIDGILYADDDLVIGADLDHNGATLGFYGRAQTGQPSALTAPLSAITHTGPTTPDYAIAAPINASAWGFSTQDEFETVMSAIRNLQIRVVELEGGLDSTTGVGIFA